MTATVYYDSANELAVLTTTFTNAAGTPTDPTTVTCTVTDPGNSSVTHTYGGASPADITRVGAGKFTLSVVCTPSSAGIDGLWGGQWNASGTVTAVQPVTWRVLPVTTSQSWYVGLEEMKDRLAITDTTQDYALQTAIASATGWISEFCGRHFNRITETRTFEPYNVWLLDVDDIATGETISVAVDLDGDGVFEQPWTKNIDYQLRIGTGQYNKNTRGYPRPYTQLQVIQSGNWLPFTWPYTHLDRVQITTTWGWPQIPWQVAEACRILTEDLFRMKDAPFGVAGVSDLGLVRISTNPWLVENLRPFIRSRHRVGV